MVVSKSYLVVKKTPGAEKVKSKSERLLFQKLRAFFKRMMRICQKDTISISKKLPLAKSGVI
jgi:hypothetical protein